MCKLSAHLLVLLVLSAVVCAQIADEKCWLCHGKPDLARVAADSVVVSLFVDENKQRVSVHAQVGCVSCHLELAIMSQLPHRVHLKPVDCTACHGAEGQEFAHSTHRRLVAAGRPDSMSCSTCHGKHDVLSSSNPLSRTHRKSIAKLCLSCHAEQEIIPGKGIKVNAYEYSVHGRQALAQADTNAAECVDCHGNHQILPADNPKSPVFKPRIPETCGRCHPAVLKEYGTSIHGQAVAQGLLDAPVCTDCHGEHAIERPQEEASSVSTARLPETCGKCHENVQLTEKYGIAAKRFSTYEDSYHGVANKYGKTIVANCASCHGYHDILPPDDAASRIHPINLAATCGRCHPNAGENFTKGKMHVQATFKNSPGVFFVRRFYYVFISVLMLIFIAYIIIEYSGFLKRRRHKKGS